MNAAWTPAEQPDSFVFDSASEEEIKGVLSKYPQERKASAVMPLLYIAQRQMGRLTGSAWVPVVAMDVIAQRLDMAAIRVYEVASFYTMFNTRPIGRYHLQVCTTTPCWLRGSDDVVEACQKATGIQHFGETSADGLFTMTEVECLGACANAPILQVDDDFYEDMTAQSTAAVIAELRAGRRPTPGPSVNRSVSAPAGGRKTLLSSSTAEKE
ncbi:complex I 24 kDa subunit family protein [Acetobacter syzygii]|uniref:NAD(P)H-dependent oxidoreductase subunit E n=1 Tax=Acetobacter syzygii TaxID=146476 RepID=A0A270BMR0_9PROT|nr:NAD(P)H-dependent oxidoreductase subunit E [Acetobacter syzygii]NSL93369.1 NAD(P)H-dependent oxidoreductase subunit E [Acetobacter syzygii]PAL26269.1 NAD(P)H-dependent oxidoreductase subunit E [Acetobacter syzygii]PAL26424.1 NAD(P)H-dependent oxidoreductase subunit E [Acetobacter syzygii]GAN70010.1 NADH-quinone oxidoreductase subunit E [Acetobacter syzygii]GBR61887.1 NADH-quinone oxidoreductase chain E [Acetobacter syzygii NRIC 0483]